MRETESSVEPTLSKEEFERIVKEKWEELKKVALEIFKELERLGLKTGHIDNSELDQEIAEKVGIQVQDLRKYAVYHIMNSSTPNYDYVKEIDLPGDLIEKAYREKLEELKAR